MPRLPSLPTGGAWHTVFAARAHLCLSSVRPQDEDTPLSAARAFAESGFPSGETSSRVQGSLALRRIPGGNVSSDLQLCCGQVHFALGHFVLEALGLDEGGPKSQGLVN